VVRWAVFEEALDVVGVALVGALTPAAIGVVAGLVGERRLRDVLAQD
jgi:hypothetical protein